MEGPGESAAEQQSSLSSTSGSAGFWHISNKIRRKTSFDSLKSRSSFESHSLRSERSSFDNSPADHATPVTNGFWTRKPRRPLITIPETTSYTNRKDSGYGSADFTPLSCQPSDTISLPRFSWQTTVEEHQRNTNRLRHVEIVIPSYAQPVIEPLKSGNSIISNFPTFPQPPKAPPSLPTHPRTRTRRHSSVLTIKPSDFPPSAGMAANGSRGPSTGPQPVLQLKDPGTATFPSLHSSRSSMSRGPSRVGDHSPVPELNPWSEPRIAGVTTKTEQSSSANELACSVARTTGNEPGALTGAATTILGDKLYVVGGRHISSRSQDFVSHVYELDLITRHWTKLETQGDVPAPRYFHTICALGDSKLICYGGLSPAAKGVDDSLRSTHEPNLVVMSDVSILDVETQTWTAMPTKEAPLRRYAHCASVVPSTSFFATSSDSQDNLDGQGGAELVIAGGQDNKSKYISQVSIFNLRSRKWTSTVPLGGDFGAYKSVLATMPDLKADEIGSQRAGSRPGTASSSPNGARDQAPLLFYSNYNFVDVRIDLKVGNPPLPPRDVSMQGQHLPPGLRFPSCGVLAGHLIISGTVVNTTAQEYSLWALNLRTLAWSKIDASSLQTGSWNKGLLWQKRNTYIILGNRKRKQGVDYQVRRMNFSHICTVELEAFGLYSYPPPRLAPIVASRAESDASNRTSVESILPGLSSAANLGHSALNVSNIADMDIIALTGEHIPVNSAILAERWGSYFHQLLDESATAAAIIANGNDKRPMSLSPSEASTLRPSLASRMSSNTITPTARSSARASMKSDRTSQSSTTLLPDSAIGSIFDGKSKHSSLISTTSASPAAIALSSRILYLPHTALTIRALVFYLYTLSLPPPTHPLCTSQILCSLLPIARTYRIPHLLSALLARLHETLTATTASDVWTAAALAAGDGTNVTFIGSANIASESTHTRLKRLQELASETEPRQPPNVTNTASQQPKKQPPAPRTLNANTNTLTAQASFSSTHSSASSSSTSTSSTSDASASTSGDSASSDDTSATNARRLIGDEEERAVWKGEVSSVVGLQKRSLRALWEGKYLRRREMEEREREERALGIGMGGGEREARGGGGLGFGVEEGEEG